VQCPRRRFLEKNYLRGPMPLGVPKISVRAEPLSHRYYRRRFWSADCAETT
jgi:hypothetical protein